MSFIKILSDQVSNKIAAGEVIERPASVVKELVENALDAHAKRITVRVERAGQRLISVTDDGDGMDSDDALLCFEPHATSKIATEEDIFHIHSFGFRGEAMPSIASVARVTLRTRRRDSQEGFQVSITGGTLGETMPVGCAPGTETTVRDLFFNVPARRKFLKSNSTEERHITEIMSLISLAHPDVAFELTLDGRKIISSGTGDDLMPRIRDIYGRDLADAMVKLDYDSGRIHIEGCITKRGVTRPSRSEQRIFVNGRPVESLPVYRGIKDGCGPMLDKGRYHPAVVFITLDPALVDINVHPAKREIRFRNEFEVSMAVRDAVADAMNRAARSANPFLDPGQTFQTVTVEPEAKPQKPVFDPAEFIRSQASAPPIEREAPILETRASNQVFQKTQPELPQFTSDRRIERIMLAAKVDYKPVGAIPVQTMPDLFRQIDPVLPPRDPEEKTEEEKPAGSFPGRKGLTVLGFLENSYIIATMKDGLVLIDQHAAHERVLYEKLLKRNKDVLSQKLLIPITLDLSLSDCRFIESNRAVFSALGFELDTFGERTVKVNAIPAALRQDNAGGMLKDILAMITENGTFNGRTDSAKLAQAACKAAVKAHDKLTMEECNALLDQMAECELPYCCPHGRPTIINISISELERRFGRK